MFHKQKGGFFIANRVGSVQIYRVDAHADVRAYIEKGLNVKDWWGNEIADHLAGSAAEANRLPHQAEGD